MTAGQLCSFHCAILPTYFSEVVEKHDFSISEGLEKSMKIMAENHRRQTMCPNSFLYFTSFNP